MTRRDEQDWCLWCMAMHAGDHNFPVRINWDNNDISVLISYGHGARWEHAGDWDQLMTILGY